MASSAALSEHSPHGSDAESGDQDVADALDALRGVTSVNTAGDSIMVRLKCDLSSVCIYMVCWTQCPLAKFKNVGQAESYSC